MKRASITEAKNQLSALIDRVRRGETVLIEDRGIPVAQLQPVSPGAEADQARIGRLVRAGVLAGAPEPPSKEPLAAVALREGFDVPAIN